MNKNGFSLAEVMVAIGLMGILALGVTRMIGNQQKAINTSESRLAGIEVFRQIQTALTKRESCEKTFAGNTSATPPVAAITIDLADATAKAEFTKILNQNGGELFKKGEKYENNNIKLIKMTIKNESIPSTGGEGLAEVEVTMERSKKNQYGSREFKKSIKLNVVTDSSGEIEKCFFDKEAVVETAKAEGLEKLVEIGGCDYDSSAETVTCDADSSFDCAVESACSDNRKHVLDTSGGSKLCCKNKPAASDAPTMEQVCIAMGGSYIAGDDSKCDVAKNDVKNLNKVISLNKIKSCSSSEQADTIELKCNDTHPIFFKISQIKRSTGTYGSEYADSELLTNFNKFKKICRNTALSGSSSIYKIRFEYRCKGNNNRSLCRKNNSGKYIGTCNIANNSEISGAISSLVCKTLHGVINNGRCYTKGESFPNSGICPIGTSKKNNPVRIRISGGSSLGTGHGAKAMPSSVFWALASGSGKKFDTVTNSSAKDFVNNKINGGLTLTTTYNGSPPVTAICKNSDTSQACEVKQILYCERKKFNGGYINRNTDNQRMEIQQYCNLKEPLFEGERMPYSVLASSYHLEASGLKIITINWHWGLTASISYDVVYTSVCEVE